MDTMKVTTLKMIIAAAGALTFLALFSVVSQQQDISIKVGINASNMIEVNNTRMDCISSDSALSSKGE